MRLTRWGEVHPGQVVLRVAGAAGDGVASVGETFARTSSRSGLHVFTYNSYQSVIRGGHVWFQVRAGNEKIYCQGDGLDVLIALNDDSVELHASTVSKGGAAVYDSKKIQQASSYVPEGVLDCGIPLVEIASRFSNNEILRNTVALGLVVRILGYDFNVFAQVIQDQFGRKATQIVQENLNAARAGYDYATDHFGVLDCQLKLGSSRRYLITGNQAVGLGAIAAGCKFYSAYPMTPASSLLHYLAAHAKEAGMVVKQAEDEIAVINMAIGAAHVGVRAMCGTSGGGFSLMTEAVGLAGMTETPIVILESQRGGPSTGLPTKTEQGDLAQVLGASQGDYPKIVVAPFNVQDCFETTVEAFNLAERYQLPVVILSDLFLSEDYETVESLDLVPAIARGEVVSSAGDEKFKRYRVTETGVSPRAFPGQQGAMFVAGSDEHGEDGALISDVVAGLPESLETRKKMMEKRMRKLQFVRAELPRPRIIGPLEAAVTLVGWGSSYGAIREAITFLGKEGVRANHLHVKYLMPFHSEAVREALNSCKTVVGVEGNYTGQLLRLIKAETGFEIKDRLLKYDGEPFYPAEIVAGVRGVLRRG